MVRVDCMHDGIACFFQNGWKDSGHQSGGERALPLNLSSAAMGENGPDQKTTTTTTLKLFSLSKVWKHFFCSIEFRLWLDSQVGPSQKYLTGKHSIHRHNWTDGLGGRGEWSEGGKMRFDRYLHQILFVEADVETSVTLESVPCTVGAQFVSQIVETGLIQLGFGHGFLQVVRH